MHDHHETPTSVADATSPAEPQAGASEGGGLDRRALLVGMGAAAAGVVGVAAWRKVFADRARVFVARNQQYDGPLADTIRDGLLATGVDPRRLRDARVLLKPNMVEPRRSSPQLSTHPAVVLAAAKVFRDWGAHVAVGEGPGHLRDTELALDESGMTEALDEGRLDFADLNYEEVIWVENKGRACPLSGFYLPKVVADADLVVSMPKLKTHHWVGVTASMKNLYGILPGVKYGWPKNVLHHAGIPQTVFDINASAPPTLAIVDGILCMQGDGPILGGPKTMGLLAVGRDLAAVDATCARIMGFDPAQISYLQIAAGRGRPIADRRIDQCGERWRELVSPFDIIDAPHLRNLRSVDGAVRTS